MFKKEVEKLFKFRSAKLPMRKKKKILFLLQILLNPTKMVGGGIIIFCGRPLILSNEISRYRRTYSNGNSLLSTRN